MTVGAGAYWQQAYQYAEANNITLIGGYHQTVGVSGGWVQAGGHSILSPNYGLGIDRVVSASKIRDLSSLSEMHLYELEYKVVTPDGLYRVANECQNQDLFWALRGGGGGTWGVVLESSHRYERQLTFQV